jgi:short-subunit dehydrogenase
MSTFKGQTALITGASAGMGVDYARELAAQGANLILVARRADRLEQVKADLAEQFSVDIRILPCDLGDATARDAMYQQLKREAVVVDMLINNAGLGLNGPFLDSDWASVQNMINVDISALTHLTQLFGQDMKARGAGNILLVASVVGHLSVPNYAVYSASKNYVRALGTALRHEFKPYGVNVTIVSPGATATEFFDVAGDTPSFMVRMVTGSSIGVVRAALRAMRRRRREVVPGVLNWMTTVQARLLPAGLMTSFVNRIFN